MKEKQKTEFSIGIDASNLLKGGGRTHIIELLNILEPSKFNITRIVIWASSSTLDLISDKPWLTKIDLKNNGEHPLNRLIWQTFTLAKDLKIYSCDILFVPGGSYMGTFKPFVTMCRNMLPFEWQELSRYGLSLKTFRLILLRYIQLYTFQSANGVIFLTNYANEAILKLNPKIANSISIPHGLNQRFFSQPKNQKDISEYSHEDPFRLVYVSIIDQYKHQWNLIAAVHYLRKETGWPLSLELIGPSYPPSLDKFYKAIQQYDAKNEWIIYRENVEYNDIHYIYKNADIGVFASSCENMPNILMEMMGAGLPIASSDKGPMPEVLADGGIYFNPVDPISISRALHKMILSPSLRESLSIKSFSFARGFSWKECSENTFKYLTDLALEYNNKT